MKKSKKPSEKKAATSKLGKVLKRDPVVYISETGNGRNTSLYVQLYWVDYVTNGMNCLTDILLNLTIKPNIETGTNYVLLKLTKSTSEV